MVISDKNRKILWGRSGNRCAICKIELIFDDDSSNNKSIVGDECHIISGQANGPRYNPEFPVDNINSYNNLMLLCKVHHKMIDDLFETYTDDILRNIKETHEKWVTKKLNSKEIEEVKPLTIKRFEKNIPTHLMRIATGKDLFRIVSKAHTYSYEYDEFKDQEEMEIISSFFQEIQDWGDISDTFEVSDNIRAEFRLNEIIKELENLGFLVFGDIEKQKLEGGKPQNSSEWNMAIIHVLRKNNETIINLEKLMSEMQQ